MLDPDLFLRVWLVVVLLTCAAWVWISVRSRRVRGEPIIPRPPVGASFCERGASGSLKYTFGGARNCLMVCIAGDRLWITPTFPFNMIAPYGLLGMDHRIARDEIVSLQVHKAWLGDAVLLEFQRPGARPVLLELRLRDPQRFTAALGVGLERA